MLTEVVIVLYNLLDGVRVSFGGQLKLNEVLVIMVLPFLYRSMEFSKYPMLKKVVLTLIALLFFQIVTDAVVENTAVRDYIRGWSQIVIAIATVVFAFKVLNSYRAIMILLVMLAVRKAIFPPMIDNLADSEMQFFKWRVFPVLNIIVYIIAVYLHHWDRKKIIPYLFILFGLFCISMDSRSNGIINIFTGLIMFALYSNFKFNWKKAAMLGVVLAIVFQGS